MKKEIKKLAVILILSGLGLAGGASFAAEFEVLDRFSVDGYTMLRGSADITGGSFTVGASTFVVQYGKVGIGTTGPGAKLDVTGNLRIGNNNADSSGYDSILWHLGDTYSGFRTVVDAANTYYGVEREYAGWQPASLVIKRDTGNVGIGTAGPVSKLDVVGTISSERTYDITNDIRNFALINRRSEVYGAGLILSGGNVTGFDAGNWDNTGAMIRIWHSPYGYQYMGNIELIANSVHGTNDADSNSYNSIFFKRRIAANTIDTSMIINGSGDVGIGTTAPYVRLDVRGQGDFGVNSGVGYTAPLVTSALEANLSSNSLITLGESGSGNANPGITMYRTGAGYRSGTATRIYQPTSEGALYFQSGTPYTAYGSEVYSTNMAILSNGNVGIGTTNPAAQLHVGGKGAIIIPIGTSLERPDPATNGMLRLNITTGKLEYYNSGWHGVGTCVAATGGTITAGGGYQIHTFTSGGTFTVSAGCSVEVLVVGGGGGGGSGNAGGGGAGGVRYNSSFAVTAQAYGVVVGGGGAATTAGTASSFSTISAAGGGYGKSAGIGGDGGSGGGGGGGGYTYGAGNIPSGLPVSRKSRRIWEPCKRL